MFSKTKKHISKLESLVEDHQKSKKHLPLQEKLRHLDSFSVERRFQGYLIAAFLHLQGAAEEDIRQGGAQWKGKRHLP